MDTEEYRKKIENDILTIMKARLEAGKMSPERAGEIASYVLENLKPHMSLDDIYAKVRSFDDHFPELLPAVLLVVQDYEEKIKKIVSEHLEVLIKQNKIDEASTVVKKALDMNLKVESSEENKGQI